QYYKYNPKGQTDREVKIDNRPFLEFCLRYATRLMKTEIELIAAADRHRATFESARTIQLSAIRPIAASLGEIRNTTPNTTPNKAKAARARRFNGSSVSKLPQKRDSTTASASGGKSAAKLRPRTCRAISSSSLAMRPKS